MTPLTDLLRAEITRRGGALPFREFMAQALYHPQHGYYSSGRASIGRGGDFFTNVSVGPLFGRLIARQFAEMWQRLGSPTAWTIVEQGAHRGDFASDALSGLAEFAPACFAATRYVIIEPVAALRGEQAERIFGKSEMNLGQPQTDPETGIFVREILCPSAAENTSGPPGWQSVEWVASLADLPPFTGVHFSNELLDAFPIHLVARTAHAWIERHVAWQDERFTFTDGPLTDPRLEAHLAPLDAPPGFVTEVNLAALAWLDALAGKLQRGFVLAIDYGYPRAQFFERTAGTLSAYAAHRREPDPLARPGEIDLTAHVEFSSLIEHATRVGFRENAFTDQHRFIVGLSRLHFTGDHIPPEDLRAFKTLMHPELMGQAFKVLCLEKGADPAQPLSAFGRARY